MRISRLAAELRMRRLRLRAYRHSPPWPGKDHAFRSELVRYDSYLVLAATMLEVPVPEVPPGPRLLAPEARAALEDRLALAGLDVLAPARHGTGDVLLDGDLCP
ncbi:MAG: hypothetical protein M3Q48_03040 [Actinomycetota bacterium]|jgi:hypothetical protein|nr:hypothetical protein [Actinomycetota bacterium]